MLSGYFSLSSSAPHLFGDRVEDFAREVRELLIKAEPDPGRRPKVMIADA